MKSILNRSFHYTPSSDMPPDYLARKFKALIRELKQAEQKAVEPARKVVQLKKEK